MEVLVTGHSGFIGRAVVRAALQQGWSVTGFDRHPKDLDGLKDVIVGDIYSQAWHIEQDLARGRFDALINLAGVLGTSELLGATVEAVQTNIEAAVRIFDGCRKAGIPCVTISPGNHTWDSIYPITKVAAERIALAYNRDLGARIAVVRAMNVFGQWQKAAPVRKLVPNLIRWAMLNEPARIYGDGEQKMDAIYVDDCAEILVRALRLLIQKGRGLSTVLEAGTGNAVTVNWMADRVWKEIHGWDAAPKVYEPMRAGEPPASVTVADPATLLPLGWTGTDWSYVQPVPEMLLPLRWFTPFDEALRETVAWYKARPEFLGLTA